MPNDGIFRDKEAPIRPIKKEKFPEKDLPYMDSLTPGEAVPKRPYGGNLVSPKDRVAKASAAAPKEETSSAPSGDLFTPDKSGVSSIHDR